MTLVETEKLDALRKAVEAFDAYRAQPDHQVRTDANRFAFIAAVITAARELVKP